MNLDHRTIAAAQSPEFDLSAFGSTEKPFIVLPSLRRAAAPTAATSDALTQGPTAAGFVDPSHNPPLAEPAAAFSPSLTHPGAQVAEGGSAALRAVLQRRAEQLAKGFDAASDDRLPIGHLLNEAQKYAGDARDWLLRRHQDPDHKHYRHKLVSSVALGLAELERLDRKQGAGA